MTPAVEKALEKLYMNLRNRPYLAKDYAEAILLELARAERLDEAKWWHNREITPSHNCEREIELQNKGYLRFARTCERVMSLVKEIKWVYKKQS